VPRTGHLHVRVQDVPVAETHQQVLARGIDRSDLGARLGPAPAARIAPHDELDESLADERGPQLCGRPEDGVALGHDSIVPDREPHHRSPANNSVRVAPARAGKTVGVPSQPRGPSRLFVIRHGQSAGNLAADEARLGGAARLDLETRDMDVDLSELGEEQARDTARWAHATQLHNAVVYSSPYRRAERTARIALPETPMILDERLREREFGVLDRLTRHGIATHFPEQAAARAFLGKFYHRPPGGESWVDVGLRVRTFFADLQLEAEPDQDIVIVTHQAVIMMMRYVLERLDEKTVLDIDRAEQIPNCSVTEYARSGRQWTLVEFASVDHLAPHEVTRASDYTGAPR
jgi:broad specificity phosphatase PhoE